MNTSLLKLLLTFAVVISFASLPAVSSAGLRFPTINLGHAIISTPPPQPWTPAGPAMNTFLGSIFTDENAEFLSISNPSAGIDMMDWPLTPAQTTTLGSAPQNFLVTPPISEHGDYEVEFNHSNNFWGCDFAFGSAANSPGVNPTDCSANIRKAIDHLIDKATFTSTDSAVHGKSIAIDSPVPPSDGLVGPNPCPTDSLFPGTSPTNCVATLSPGTTGGVSFNCAAEAAPCPTGTGTATGQCGTESAPGACDFPWMRAFGSADFCAAAQYLITAGLAASVDNNCVLQGVVSAVTASPINFFVRSDHTPRFHIGTGIAETICALFTGGYTIGCVSGSSSTPCIEARTTTFAAGAVLCVTEGPITAFPGFTTCKSSTGSCTPIHDWWMYTAGFGGVFPFDSLLYFNFNSIFVSNPGVAACASTTTSAAASNYDYVCNATYDVWSHAMEFALCAGAAGDPVAGSSSNAVGGTCPTAPAGTSCPTTPSSCSAVSAGYISELLLLQANDVLPIYSQQDTFSYLPGWLEAINSSGAGLPNFWTWLNAYSQSPAQAGAIRQGFKQTTTHISPYTSSTIWDFFVLGNVMDSLFAQNPLNNNQLIDWMTKSHTFVPNTSLGYTPPAGTTVSVRSVLRNDIFFQNGQKVTSSDVAFSYISLVLNGAFQASPLIGELTGVTVLSPTNFDLNLKARGPFTELTIGGPTVFPGALWYNPTSGCPASWASLITAPTPITYPVVNSSCLNTTAKLSGSSEDAVHDGIFTGSGPWACQNTGSNTAVPVGTVGTGCSNDNTGSPTVSYTLTRYGCTLGTGGTTCVAPNTTPSVSSQYFRSSANAARWFWSGNTGSVSHDLINISTLANCFLKPLGTAGCTHWQQGIGAPNGSATVGLSQISGVSRFYLLNWTAPLAWTALNGIDIGTANSFNGIPAPTLQETDPILPSGQNLQPASVAGCAGTYPATAGYDC